MGIIKIKIHNIISWLINCIKCWNVNAIFKYCDWNCIKKVKINLIKILVVDIAMAQSKVKYQWL